MTDATDLAHPEADDHVTIPGLLAGQAKREPAAPFARFPDSEISYGELDALARQVAKGLIALGIRKGDHVALMMPNCADWLTAYFGILYAGGVVVALNARYKRHEVAYTVEHSDARMLLTTSAIADHVNFADLITEAFPSIGRGTFPTPLRVETAPRLEAVILFGGAAPAGFGTSAELIALGADRDDAEVEEAFAHDVTQPAVLLYTSGTTANPKGCVLSHKAIKRSWYTFADIVHLKSSECIWMPMPFFHTGGIGPMAAVMSRGASFITQTHFQPAGVVALIQKYRVEHLYAGFPQLSLPILQHPEYAAERFPYIRSMLNVGPPPMQHSIQQQLPEDAKLLNLFGMTEGAGIVTFTPWDAPLDIRATSSGKPPSHTEIRIIDPETGAACPANAPGEIQFRGGGAFSYYYKDKAATASTILDSGWVRTGDRGKIDDDGWLYYLGRLKDMLKVGGENVSAAEIEAFLTQHPSVQMVQVIGAPEPRLSEVPVAFVELVPGRSATRDELIEMCQGQLAKWKIPRDVIFVTDWPMSSTKVQKFRLRELLPERLRG